MTSDPAPQSAPTASASQPSSAEPTASDTIPSTSSGIASPIVTAVTAYEPTTDVIPEPGCAANGLRPARATGTTIDADDTEITASPESSTPIEIPKTAGNTRVSPTNEIETIATTTTEGRAKASNAAARPIRSSMPRTPVARCCA